MFARSALTRLSLRRPSRWLLVAGAIAVVGVALSVGAGLARRSTVLNQDRQQFQTTATDVSETVEALLRRDADFVGTLRAVMTIQPHQSQHTFMQWYTALEGDGRQVGGLGTTVVRAVPASQIARFLAVRDADPTFRSLVNGKVLPVRDEGHAQCLLSTSVSAVRVSEPVAAALQGDWCSARSAVGRAQAHLTQAAMDSGQFLVFPVNSGGLRSTFFEAAFYRRGAMLTGVADRRAAIAGWVVSSFDISAVIKAALERHTDLNVALYHSNPGAGEQLVAQTRGAAAGRLLSHSVDFTIEGPWRVRIQGALPSGGLSSGTQGALLFASGAIVTLLVAALALVLGRSRQRALGMVEQKTGELRHQALHDALTGLPNRVLALDRVEQMIARARRSRTAVAAMYVDLDGFKHVNDTFGHAAGDELLRQVAARLTGVIRQGDTAARLGGDEFVVLVEGPPLDAGPELVAERILQVLREPYDLRSLIGRELTLTASVGIACGPRESSDELLRDADVALYEAKAAGRNRHVVFQDSMHTSARERLTLEMDLADALAHDQLFLQYQPTFDLRNERVIGVEALIRWRHPTRGVISPDRFIPLAEETGLILPIGRWVLAEACLQAAAWHRRGYEIGIAVNVSARQLDSDGLIDDVNEALDASGLDAATLTLEVTETTLMRDAEMTAKRLQALKKLGVHIAIDDFGTGYSSLSYLRQFPVDAIKIDRSFIDGIAQSSQSSALVHTLVALGKTLRLETLAEGIEDRAQLQTLQREHCDQGQGFLFSRPLDPDAITVFLEGQPAGHAAQGSPA